MKEILVSKEKHNTYYYDVSTKEQLHKACVTVLKRHLKEGFYNVTEPENNTGYKNEGQIKKLKDGEIKDFACKAWLNYVNELLHYNKNKCFLNNIKAIIETKWDDETAWYGVNKERSFAFMYLNMRRDYEYEECSIETLDEV